MTFTEKSTMTMTALLVVVFGLYFALVLGPIAVSADRQGAFTGLIIAATVALAILAALSHIVLAVFFRSAAATPLDERNLLIALRSERSAGYVLAVGVFAGIVLAMVDAARSGSRRALLASWVLAQVTEGVTSLLLYRRGV